MTPEREPNRPDRDDRRLGLRFELGSPRRLLAMLGVFLILLVTSAGRSSALLGLLLVLGVVLIVVATIWSLLLRRRRPDRNPRSVHRSVDRQTTIRFAVVVVAAAAVEAFTLALHMSVIAGVAIAVVVGLAAGGLLRLSRR